MSTQPIGRLRLLGLSAFWYATSLKWFILFFLTPALVAEIVPGGEKNRWWGLIVAIGAMEAMVGPAIMGALSDRTRSRFGRRIPYIAIGAALTATALMTMAQAGSVWAFMLAYLMIQISDDVGTGPYSSAVPELVSQEQRGIASGAMALLQLVGQLTAVAIGLALGDPFAIFVALAVTNIVCAVITILVLRGLERGLPMSASTARLKVAEFWAPLRDADFRWAWGTRFLNALGFYIVLNYLTNYMTDVVRVFRIGPIEFGTPFEGVIALAAIISLVGAVSAVVGGRLADQRGRKRVVVAASWIMFGAMIAFVLAPGYAALVPIAAVFGCGYGAYLSADWALVSDVLPDSSSLARDMGVWQMSVAAPQLFAGLLGAAIDFGNARGPSLGYVAAFLFASVVFLFGGQLVTRIKGST